MPRSNAHHRPRRHADLPAWYAAILAEQRESGLSISEFAEIVGTSPQTLIRWHRRLKSSSPKPHRSGPESRVAHRLVEVIPASTPPQTAIQASMPPFTIRLAADRQIEVPTGFDADELGRLVQVLEAC